MSALKGRLTSMTTDQRTGAVGTVGAVPAEDASGEPTAQPLLRLGQIVYGPHCGERGVVVRSCGHGGHPIGFGPVRHDDCVIMLGAGHHVVTSSRDDDWRPVPVAATSAVERVRSVMRTYEVPTWLDVGDEPRDVDSFPFALVRALLPPAVADEVMERDGIPSFCDLVEVVAERLDKLQGDRSMGES